MPRFIMTIGAPGAGKSTWVKKFEQENENVVVHSSDSIRDSIKWKSYGYQKNDHKDIFLIMQLRAIADLQKGKTVVYDATNIGSRHRKNLLHQLRIMVPELSLEAVLFDIPLDTCLERNAQREGKAKVPEDVVFRMHRHLVKPSASEGWDKLTIIDK